jgi:hypothetical protein
MKTYRADRTKLLEWVKTWKLSEIGSEFYRDPSQRISVEETMKAPWNDESDSTVPVRWYNESVDSYDGVDFEDIAEQISLDDLAEHIYSFGYDENLIEGIVNLLVEGMGKTLLIGNAGSDSGLVVQFYEDNFYAAEMEVDVDSLSEGAISMQLLASTIGDGNAPVYPGFPPVELQNRLYEVLHSAVVLKNTVNEEDDLAEIISEFCTDLSSVISELMINESEITSEEAALIYETAAGVFAGIQEATGSRSKK